jgi:hypothetical protein
MWWCVCGGISNCFSQPAGRWKPVPSPGVDGASIVFRNSRISLSAGRRACEPAAKPAIPGVILLHNGFVWPERTHPHPPRPPPTHQTPSTPLALSPRPPAPGGARCHRCRCRRCVVCLWLWPVARGCGCGCLAVAVAVATVVCGRRGPWSAVGCG